MNEKCRIFVVDDDSLILGVFNEILAADCVVETFGSAQACLERLRGQRPDLFVIDANMPDVDGFALCRLLKDDVETRDIPVTLISGSDDIETCLAAYEAGAEDFLRKPVEPAELESKVRVARRLVEQQRALREQAGYAQRTALSAMTSMGELGVVLHFLSKSFGCTSLREVGGAVLEALQQYGLQGALQLRAGGTTLTMSRNGVDLPLEVAVLNHVRDCGRIFQFRSRCAFNFERITVMVNNMPLEDAERCGRIRDNVALLTEGADARLRAIAVEDENRARQAGAANALPRVHAALDAVQDNYRRNCFELTQLMIQYEENLLKSFVHLGLSEQQEEYITTMSHRFVERMVDAQDQSLAIIGQLEALAKDLERLARS